MWLSLHDELLVNRYLSNSFEFDQLVRECRELTRAICNHDCRAMASEAIDLFEALFRLAREGEEKIHYAR